MPSGGFETQGYSPPRRHALHLLVFSTSSSSPPPHLLHHLVFFSTPASCFPCPSSPLGFLPRHPIVVVGLRCAWPEFPGSSIRWPLHSAWEKRGGVAPLPSTPSPFFLCGSLYRRCIPSSSFASWDTMPALYFLAVVGRPLRRDRVALVIAGVVR